MDGVNNGMDTQQVFGLSMQKSALETQAGLASQLLDGASQNSSQQNSQAINGLRSNALGELGIGLRIDTVA